MFEKGLIDNIVLPLLVGPLKYQQCPIFTLKFSLFVVQKLVPILEKFGLLHRFIQYAFIAETVRYDPETLQKGVLRPFSLAHLLCLQQVGCEECQVS